MTNHPESRSQIRRKTIQRGGTMDDAQAEIERVEGRELCSELAFGAFVVLGSGASADRLVVHMESLARGYADESGGNTTAVPCLVTPLLTADEREKLIGDKP